MYNTVCSDIIAHEVAKIKVISVTVYFDNAATTKPCPEAVEAVAGAMTRDFGNPSSGHAAGRRAAGALRAAREAVAAVLRCEPGEIVFTSGGTEADNMALRGAAYLQRHKRRHIITSEAEHDAVRKTARDLARQGYEVTFLKPDSTGAVSVDRVLDALREDTGLLSLMLVNNETGAVTDVAAIAAAVKRADPDVIVHSDCVQALLKVPFTPKGLGADLVTVSSHKIHGPKGAGALYIKKGLRLPGLLTGGGQENGVRPGTEPMPAILGFAAAARAGMTTFPDDMKRMVDIKKYLMDNLAREIPGVRFIGESRAPHILSVSLPGYKSEVLMNLLDARGICLSKSSACKKGARSHVLEAMGESAEVIDGAIRVSLSRYSTVEEADILVRELGAASETLRVKIK